MGAIQKWHNTGHDNDCISVQKSRVEDDSMNPEDDIANAAGKNSGDKEHVEKK